jgi:antitoxin component of MazEF toxin-antitoxin module
MLPKMHYGIELLPFGDGAVALLPDELLEQSELRAGDELDWKVRGQSIFLSRSKPREEFDAPPQP